MMERYIRLAFILLVLFTGSISSCYSQSYPYTHFTVKDGLINSTVYSIHQDPTGFMWLGTENGLSRFDGNHFLNYTLTEIGISSLITAIADADSGALYLGTSADGIIKFFPEQVKHRKINKNQSAQASQIYIENSKITSIHNFHLIQTVDIPTGNVSTLYNLPGNLPITLCRLKNGTILSGNPNGLELVSNKGTTVYPIKGMGKNSVYSVIEQNDSSLIIGCEGWMGKIKGNVLTDTLVKLTQQSGPVFNICTDFRNNLWFSIYGSSSIWLLKESRLIDVSSVIGINKGIISKIYCDRSGGIWVSLLGKGVFYFNNPDIFNYTASADFANNQVKKIIRLRDDRLLLGTNDGLAVVNTGTQQIRQIKHHAEVSTFVKDVIAIKDHQLVACVSDNWIDLFEKHPYTITATDYSINYCKANCLLSDKKYLFAGSWDNNILVYDVNTFERKMHLAHVLQNDPNQTYRINDMEHDRFGNLWVAGQKGFCIFDQRFIKYTPQVSLQQLEIRRLSTDDKGNLMLLSSSGIQFVAPSSEPEGIRFLEFIPVERPTCVIQTGVGEFLIGTPQGLLFMRNNRRLMLSVEDGLLSEGINTIYYEKSNGTLWIGCNEGLMQCNIRYIRNLFESTSEISFLKIRYGNQVVNPEKEITMKYNGQPVNIIYHAFNYQNPQRVTYQYRINDTTWNYSQQGSIDLPSPEPGKYVIGLRSGLSNGKWGPEQTIIMIIEPPYYKTWWFRLCIIALSLFALFYFIRKQLQLAQEKQNEKKRIESKLVELQQKALAGNLNPHFVFNSLNSIQNFINSHQPAEANEYLAKFSRLMRMHLNAVEKSFIPLQEEIHRLEYYLSLEQMRFGNKLSWKIEVDPALDIHSVAIPNMIIQPFVENAIWHGIMPSDQPGNVILSVSLLPTQNLQIIISDNGIGLEHAMKFKKEGHESKGVQLIKERLHLLDSNAKNYLTFENRVPGTKVIITLTPEMYRKSGPESTFPQ